MERIKKITTTLGLVVVIILAIIIRTKQIGKIPAGFYADEAAIAYNGYSLLQTGRDEYGKKWPLLFRSFGEYKTPTYSYLLIPVFKIWGKSVTSARSITVISGFLTVIGVMFLTKIWFKRWTVVWLSGITLLLLPWHLIYSRSIYEVNLSLSLIVWGLIFLEIKLKNTKLNWPVGIGMLGLSIVTYNASRVFVPMLGLIWLIFNYREVFDKRNQRWLVLAVCVGIISLLPILLLIFTSGLWARAGINIFSNGNPWGYDNGKFKIYFQIRELFSLYFGYLNPYYLFKLGDPGIRSRLIDTALLYGWQLPFILIGLRRLEKESKKNIAFVLSILLISPLAAAMTRDPMSSIRSLFIVVPLSILIGLGMSKIVEEYKWFGKLILLGLFLYSAGRIYLSIFKISDYYNFRDWDYGLNEVASEINKIPKEMPVTFVGNRLSYIQLAFFMADPKEYIGNNITKEVTNYYTASYWPNERKIGRIDIRDIVWEKDILINQVIIFGELGLGDRQIAEHCMSKVFEVKGLDGKRLYIAVKTNPELKLAKGKNGCLND